MDTYLSLLSPHLQLGRDASHPASLDALHELRVTSSYLVVELLAGENSDLLTHVLAGVEVTAQTLNTSQ